MLSQQFWKNWDLINLAVIPGTSTIHALVSMFYNWAKATDGTGNDVRVLVMDYRKAFDLINNKLSYIINCIGNFLSSRNQRVKLAGDCLRKRYNHSDMGRKPDLSVEERVCD